MECVVEQGRFPFKKNSGLKFRKFHVPNVTVHSGCTHPTQATARLVIVLVSRIQKSGTGNNNFVKWKGTFRSISFPEHPLLLSSGWGNGRRLGIPVVVQKDRGLWERDCISVRPTEMTRPVTVDHLQSWSQIFRSDQTEIVRSI